MSDKESKSRFVHEQVLQCLLTTQLRAFLRMTRAIDSESHESTPKNWQNTALASLMIATPDLHAQAFNLPDLDSHKQSTQSPLLDEVISDRLAGMHSRFGRREFTAHTHTEHDHGDVYGSLDELKKDKKEGVDYTIRSVDAHSKLTVVAPHGGYIEPGTSELATAIAGDDYNLFDFGAIRHEGAGKLHVTSENFRDPELQDLLAQSDASLSLHGMAGDGKTIYLGGLNCELKQVIAKHLREAGFSVDADPPKLKGDSKDNFVNQTRDGGAQLELPMGLRKEMLPDLANGTYDPSKPGTRSKRFDDFVRAVREAMAEYRTCTG